MRILIIRHGDPNYELDCLTERGRLEAEALSERLANEKIDYFYCSPLNRAKETAEYTLKKFDRKAQICDWMQEFPAQINRPDRPWRKSICWDWLPQDYADDDQLYDRNDWFNQPVYQAGEVSKEYQHVCDKLDELLLNHGYKRNRHVYEPVKANDDTIALFCHFGLECVLLSHLLNVSPVVLWHGFCAAPTSVTTLYSEERRKGIVAFRIAGFGDTGHLYAKGISPSDSARFCEMFDNEKERHD